MSRPSALRHACHVHALLVRDGFCLRMKSAARGAFADRSPFAPREESRLLRDHATRVSPLRVPPETNGPQSLWPRAAKVSTMTDDTPPTDDSQTLAAKDFALPLRHAATSVSKWRLQGISKMAISCQTKQSDEHRLLQTLAAFKDVAAAQWRLVVLRAATHHGPEAIFTFQRAIRARRSKTGQR